MCAAAIPQGRACSCTPNVNENKEKYMKICMLYFVSLLPLILSCKKDESEKLELNITSTEWYTTTRTFNTTTFCEVHLKISGNANAELLSILTYGDGLKGCG